MKKWVYILYDHESFNAAKSAIVCVDGDYEFTNSYRYKATEILCNHINLNIDEVVIHDWKFLGSHNEVKIIDA